MLRGGGVEGGGVDELTALFSSPPTFVLLIAASGSFIPVACGVALDAAPVDYAAALSTSVILRFFVLLTITFCL